MSMTLALLMWFSNVSRGVYYDPFLAAHAATQDPNYRLQVRFYQQLHVLLTSMLTYYLDFTLFIDELSFL